MSLGCLRLVLCHAVRAPKPLPCRPLSGHLSGHPSGHLGVALQQCSWFCRSLGGGEESAETVETEQKKKKKKADPKGRVTVSSVGRRILQRQVQLLGEDGGELGLVHRADALRMMDERGLKLVPVNELSNPPVYRLMSGKQIHQEQMKLREKQKSKTAGPVQVKELTLSTDIAPHDLDTKLKQVVTWLEKKHHIRLTLRATRGYSSENTLDTVLDHMVEKMSVPVGFVSKPRLIREGRSAMCILRPPSAKELQITQNPPKPPRPEPANQNTASTSETNQSKDSEQQ